MWGPENHFESKTTDCVQLTSHTIHSTLLPALRFLDSSVFLMFTPFPSSSITLIELI